MNDLREELRRKKNGTYALTWRGSDGLTYSAEGQGVDVSLSGLGMDCPREFNPGCLVYVQARDGSVEGDSVVVHCSRHGHTYRLGLELRDPEEAPQARPPALQSDNGETDYYDILQISPKAEMETIHRVYRIMALRFHPDNPQTGDVEEFIRLKTAYSVLSDPVRRGEYDSMRQVRDSEPMPIFELKDFVTGVEAESNRRLGVLSLLYNQRRMDPDHPGVSLLDLEKRMGFPREYLSFTMWYLRAKDFAVAADNSDYTVTAAGADFLESNAPQNEILTKLIKRGPMRVYPASKASEPSKQDPAKRPVPKYIAESPKKGA
jgi:DnaJ domain